MKRILILGCILLLIFCAPKKTVIETEGLEEVVVFGEETAPAVSEDTFPPQAEPLLPPPPVIQEPLPAQPAESILIPAPVVEEPVIPEPPVQPQVPVRAPQQVLGFRVQIFASMTEENASRIATDAREVFDERVYVEYVAPYYKVRVGDYLTREEVEPLKNKALDLGYRGAFIVETMVTP